MSVEKQRARRGNAIEVFGPAVWVETARASLKGQSAGKPAGDPFQMPGTFGVGQDGINRRIGTGAWIKGSVEGAIHVQSRHLVAVDPVAHVEIAANKDAVVVLARQRVDGAIKPCSTVKCRIQRAVGPEPRDSGPADGIRTEKIACDDDLAVRLDQGSMGIKAAFDPEAREELGVHGTHPVGREIGRAHV